MLTNSQIAEGVRAGLVRVEFTAPTGPRQYIVKITNGSGVKATTLTAAGGQTVAVEWATRWAASLGEGWHFLSIIRHES